MKAAVTEPIMRQETRQKLTNC